MTLPTLGSSVPPDMPQQMRNAGLRLAAGI
jgi:hypothetical protein